MLLFLGLGTQFSIMETITRIVVDAWPGHISHRVVLSVACSLMCCAGLAMTMEGGMYVLQMMDNHAGRIQGLVVDTIYIAISLQSISIFRFKKYILRGKLFYPQQNHCFNCKLENVKILLCD